MALRLGLVAGAQPVGGGAGEAQAERAGAGAQAHGKKIETGVANGLDLHRLPPNPKGGLEPPLPEVQGLACLGEVDGSQPDKAEASQRQAVGVGTEQEPGGGCGLVGIGNPLVDALGLRQRVALRVGLAMPAPVGQCLALHFLGREHRKALEPGDIRRERQLPIAHGERGEGIVAREDDIVPRDQCLPINHDR